MRLQVRVHQKLAADLLDLRAGFVRITGRHPQPQITPGGQRVDGGKVALTQRLRDGFRLRVRCPGPRRNQKLEAKPRTDLGVGLRADLRVDLRVDLRANR